MSGAAVIIARQNKYMHAFQKAEALSPEQAKTLEELGCIKSLAFRKLEGRGVLIKTDDDKYYMDAKAAREFVAARRRFAFYLLAVLGIVIIVFYFLKG